MKKVKNNKNNGTAPAVKILWRIVFFGVLASAVVFAGAYFGLFGKLPSLHQLENPEADLATEIYADDGKTMIGKIYSENRVSVNYEDIAPGVIEALIATEDERFYRHSGVDARGIARAIWGLGKDGGGSTITQQLAKHILKQGKGNPLIRIIDKIKEWIVAIKLERNFTKQEIIALYLNRVSWLNVFGIRNASLIYYQKEPSELSVDESALLVGMLKGPGAYNPRVHPEAATGRRNLVIDQMVRNKMITPIDAEKYKKLPLGIKYKQVSEESGIAPYFRSVLIKKLSDWAKNTVNPQTGEPYDLYRDGLKIFTTINPSMQRYAEEALIKHMTSIQKTFNATLKKDPWKGHQDILDRAMKESDRWRNLKDEGKKDEEIRASFKKPVKMKIFAWNANREKDTTMTPMDSIKYLKQMMQSAILAMDPATGEVKAWVGGIDFKWFKFDHVTAKRQVGSTFKPILYTLGITDAGLTPETFIGGKTITLANKTITGNGGTMAYALARSLNDGAWDLMDRIGPKRTADFAHEIGIKSDIPVVPSIALGTADIKLIEMVQAYSMFPNHGFNVEPVLINRIEDKNGNIVATFQPEMKQVISETDAYTMVRMMQGVVDYGTGGSLRWRFGINNQLGGKTGTTDDNTDGWFIGYSPQLLVGVWSGFDDPFLKLTGEGSRMALPEFAYFFQKVFADKKSGIDPDAIFEKPQELQNDPIFADEKFASIARDGKGSDYNEESGFGSESGYNEHESDYVPLESDLEQKNDYKQVRPTPQQNYIMERKDTIVKKSNTAQISGKDKKQPKAVMPRQGVKTDSDY